MGAPDARQVADRFHILKNLGDALEELLSRLYQELCRLYESTEIEEESTEKPTAASSTSSSGGLGRLDELGSLEPEAPAHATPTAVAVEATDAVVDLGEPEEPDIRLGQTHLMGLTGLMSRSPRRRERDVQRSCARRSVRLARYEEVARLHELGWSQYAIAEKMDMSRKTVARWLSKGSFPEYRYPAVRPSKLDAYTGYLRERWGQGCHNGRQLLDELQAQGYRGGRTIVREYLSSWRAEGGKGNFCGQGNRRGWRHRDEKRLERPRQLRWLLLKKVDELDDDDYQKVMKLCQCSQEVALAYGLVTDFQDLVRNRKAEQLANWVDLALASGVAEMASFARGVQRDFAAVYAGMELEWSQGPVEGHVNRLKMIKRTMFGRANFDLLRLRVLHSH